MKVSSLEWSEILALLDEDARQLARLMREAPTLRAMGVDGMRKMIASVPRVPGPQMEEVEDREFPGPYGPVPVRIYRPRPPGEELAPVLLYFHGGGMVMGDLDSYDALCREIASRSGVMVVSVDYRLAPEHTFPVGTEEAYAALQWLHGEARQLGLDPVRLGVAGDSAGGGLAAAAALMSRDRGGPSILAQFLFYPGVDRIEGYESATLFADAPVMTAEDVVWMKNMYLGSDPAADNAYGAPARATSLAGLPPAVVVSAEVDPVRDSVEAYGHRLRADRVPTTLIRYPGVFHGFLSQSRSLARADQALDEIAALINLRMRGKIQ